jgi:hypothetical protein
MNATVEFAKLSGLEQLRAAFDGTFKGIGKTLNFPRATLEEGRVVFEGGRTSRSTIPSAPCMADTPPRSSTARWPAPSIPR